MGRFSGKQRRAFSPMPIAIALVGICGIVIASLGGGDGQFALMPAAQALESEVPASTRGFGYQSEPGPAESDSGLQAPSQARGGGMSVSTHGSTHVDGIGNSLGVPNRRSLSIDPDTIVSGDTYGARADAASVRDKTLSPDLIRTAGISVKVADAPGAMNEAMELAKRMGGYYQSNRASKGQYQQAVADVTLRIPVARFDATLVALRKLGEVIDDSSESQDVTAEIADVGARLKVLRAEEESYVTMLRMAKKVGEVLEIKDRLSTTRQEIESLTAQQKALKDQASYSTISCHFEERPKVNEPEAPKNWTDDAWANAVNGLKSVGRFLGQAAITLFVYAPVWLPLALVAWLLFRRRPTP